MSAAPSFASHYAQFVDDLLGTFPEFGAQLRAARGAEDSRSHFISVWQAHTDAVAAQDARIFAGVGVELVRGFAMTSTLWGELSSNTHAAIWKHISTLLLLDASEKDSELWDISGFQQSMKAMMDQLKTAAGAGADGSEAGGFADMFEKLGKMAEGFGFKDLGGAADNFKIPERLFKGHIARIVEELVKEFKPEDFGITEEMLEVKDPKAIFGYLQEIFTKKPDLLMSAGQKIAKKLQAKFASGAIKREEIIREVEELMKEFSDNSAFSELFGSLGDMLKTSEKETGNEGSARRREVQERLRRKAAEKEAKKAAGPGTNIVVHSSAEEEAARHALIASLIAEEEAAKKSTKGKKK